MNLQSLANEYLQGFDPKKGNPNDAFDDGLPQGTYDVVVEKAGWRSYDSGFTAVAFSLEVVTGDHAGKVELINISLSGEAVQKHAFLLKKNVRLISQMAHVTGIELTDEDWEYEDTVGQAMRHAVGHQLILHVERGTSKKGKSFTNYSFEAYDDDVEKPSNKIEVTDEDLPF